jgi:hypothetical protein
MYNNVVKSPVFRHQGKEFFRTCNVLPFSCTHLALWRRQGKRPKVHAKQKGFKNFFTSEGEFSEKLGIFSKVKIFQNPSCYILEKINENYDSQKNLLAIMMH